MTIKCPACGKSNALSEPQPCPRCGCELERLFELAVSADHALEHAAAALRSKQWADALGWARESWQRCHSQESARLAFLAAVALRHDNQALEWYRHAIT